MHDLRISWLQLRRFDPAVFRHVAFNRERRPPVGTLRVHLERFLLRHHEVGLVQRHRPRIHVETDGARAVHDLGPHGADLGRAIDQFRGCRGGERQIPGPTQPAT